MRDIAIVLAGAGIGATISILVCMWALKRTADLLMDYIQESNKKCIDFASDGDNTVLEHTCDLILKSKEVKPQ